MSYEEIFNVSEDKFGLSLSFNEENNKVMIEVFDDIDTIRKELKPETLKSLTDYFTEIGKGLMGMKK